LGEGAVNSTAIIIGNELIITDPATGSEVHIFLTSLGASIEIRPADTAAGTLTPGVIVGQLNGSNRPYLDLRSPQLNGAGFSDIQLYADELGNEIITLNGSAGIQLNGPVSLGINSDFAANANEVTIGSAGLLDMVNDTPTGNVTTVHSRGIVAGYVYTGGTGATSAGATEAALVAWTSSDQCRFKNNHLYSLECTVGVFSSVAGAGEVAAVRIRSAVNSTAAQQLAEVQLPAPAGASVCSYTFTRYVKNVSGADIDKTALGITVARAAGAGNHSIFGNAVGTNWAIVIQVKDEGLAADSNMTNAAVAIT